MLVHLAPAQMRAMPPPFLPSPSDLIAVPQDEMKTAGFQIARGLLLDLSFAMGSMQVDDAKNAVVYGEGGAGGGWAWMRVLLGFAVAGLESCTNRCSRQQHAHHYPRLAPHVPTSDATALRILHGGIEPPREMQPLYGCLNSGGRGAGHAAAVATCLGCLAG